MKKLLTLILPLAIILGMVACGESEKTEPIPEKSSTQAITFYDIEFEAPKEWDEVEGEDETLLYFKTYDKEGNVETLLMCSFTKDPKGPLSMDAYMDAYIEGIGEGEGTSDVKTEDTLVDGVASRSISLSQNVSGEIVKAEGVLIPTESGIHTLMFHTPEKDDYELFYTLLDTVIVNNVGKAKKTTIEEAEDPIETEEAEMTTGQKNAVDKAEIYLDVMSFSKKRLIEQLEYDGFTKAESKFAADYVDVNWKEQAVLRAETYLKTSSFSKQGLIDQLEYEGFTKKQAKYGADKAYK